MFHSNWKIPYCLSVVTVAIATHRSRIRAATTCRGWPRLLSIHLHGKRKKRKEEGAGMAFIFNKKGSLDSEEVG